MGDRDWSTHDKDVITAIGDPDSTSKTGNRNCGESAKNRYTPMSSKARAQGKIHDALTFKPL